MCKLQVSEYSNFDALAKNISHFLYQEKKNFSFAILT